MTMQSGGQISIGQAMAECQIGQQQWDANSSQLTRLAGVGQNQQYAWSYWYGKSFGTVLTESWTQYFTRNYSGSTGPANFGRSLYLYKIGGFSFGGNTGQFSPTGGDTTAGVGNWPTNNINGFIVDGFYRNGTALTVIANCSLDGVRFVTDKGDNVTLTNDISYSLAFGPNLWTFYGADSTLGNPPYPQSRQLVLNLYGPANRPQPPSGYVNGQPPVTSTGGGGNHSTSHHCFVAGSLVLMADWSWKEVQLIQPGDMLMGPAGPVKVKYLHVATVGSERSLMTFREDHGHIWTSDHPHWVRQGDKQWWWSGQPNYLRKAVESGLIRGLDDPFSILSGPAEFAHIEGFRQLTPKPLETNPDMKVFVPVVEDSPIIVNGYLTGGFMNEQAFDYKSLDWLQFLKRFA